MELLIISYFNVWKPSLRVINILTRTFIVPDNRTHFDVSYLRRLGITRHVQRLVVRNYSEGCSVQKPIVHRFLLISFDSMSPMSVVL